MQRRCIERYALRLTLLLGIALSIALPVVAQACAMVDDEREFSFKRPPVTIEREAAIIVWDAAKRREHFVRRAEFKTDRRDIGF